MWRMCATTGDLGKKHRAETALLHLVLIKPSNSTCWFVFRLCLQPIATHLHQCGHFLGVWACVCLADNGGCVGGAMNYRGTTEGSEGWYVSSSLCMRAQWCSSVGGLACFVQCYQCFITSQAENIVQWTVMLLGASFSSAVFVFLFMRD